VPTVAAWPLVSTIPLSKLSDEIPLKVPLALLGQVKVGLRIVIPLPTNLLARTEALTPAVTVTCPLDTTGKTKK
jgi:hypothetical protein